MGFAMGGPGPIPHKYKGMTVQGSRTLSLVSPYSSTILQNHNIQYHKQDPDIDIIHQSILLRFLHIYLFSFVCLSSGQFYYTCKFVSTASQDTE